MIRVRWITLVVLIMALVAGCVTSPGKAIRSPSDLDRKLDNTSYIEEGDLVALIANTRIAYSRDNPDYLPLEVAIVNKGLPGLSLTAEAFTLIDGAGTSYPVVDGREVGRSHNIDVDRRLGTLAPVVRGRYGGYRQVPAALTTSFDKPIPRDLHLPRFSWSVEMLYFPRPEEGVRGRIFELFLNARELEEPVFVRFKVAGPTEGEE